MSVELTRIYTSESPRAQTYNVTYTGKQYFIKEKILYFLVFLDLNMWSQYRESIEKHIVKHLDEIAEKRCYFQVEIWLCQNRRDFDRQFRTPQRQILPIGTVFKPKWKSKISRNFANWEVDDAEKFYNNSLNKVFGEIG